MKRGELQTWRQGPQIDPDRRRVIVKPFVPGDDARQRGILKRVATIEEAEAQKLLEIVRLEFGDRHRDLERAFERRFEEVHRLLPTKFKPSRTQQLLIGAYFCCEYSLEAAALFNPSIVVHPDQRGVPSGSVRFIMSLRATGEGHISSIEFRTGTVDARGEVSIDPPSRYVTMGLADVDPEYDRADFERKLQDDGFRTMAVREVLRPLGGRFKRSQIRAQIARYLKRHRRLSAQALESVRWVGSLSEMNYSISFSPDQPLAERALFPVSSFESNGIEDARFVRFVDDRGTATYYGTYTAYNGRAIRPLMLETSDFMRFTIHSLSGAAARNKGMALFPRKVRGKYAMISRQDAESLYLVYSDNLFSWKSPRMLLRPSFAWEFLQIGNCGSPLETSEGWLLLTHGVGPMRKYCIGAVLLDREDPSRITKRLRVPLVAPDAEEREGYVPNVVYTCGAALQGDNLIIPYALSDYASRVATVSLKELLQKMD